MLLFLKNVENIETYQWPLNSAAPILIKKTSIKTSPALRKKRSFVLTSTLKPTPQINDYAMLIQRSTANSSDTIDETWVVCNQLGGDRATNMVNNPDYVHMKLVPWSGVASRLPTDTSQKSPVGSAYCFLPLPVKTGLPVHVNGYFELSSNRRDVWWGDDMAGDGRAR